MTAVEDLWAEREVEQVVLLAYRRKVARMQPTDFDTHRDYRAELARVEELIERSELILAENSQRILEAWDEARKVKPTTIPQPWGGAT